MEIFFKVKFTSKFYNSIYAELFVFRPRGLLYLERAELASSRSCRILKWQFLLSSIIIAKCCRQLLQRILQVISFLEIRYAG